MPETRSDSPPSPRGWPLRTWLTAVNAAILLFTVAASVWIAWDNGDRALDDLAGQIQRRAGAQVDGHLQAFLGAPHTVTRLMADAVEQGEISADDPAALYRYMHRLVSLFPGLSYINIGTEDGRFRGLGRAGNASDALVIEETHPPERDVLHQYALDAGGVRGELIRTLPFSDHREQVWYREPRQRDAAVWTSIYSWVDNPEILVASAAVPVHGRVEGVVGVDMFLSNISEFLGGLDISPRARAFIVERDGLLVASSLGRLPFRLRPEGAVRVHAAQAGDEAIAEAVARLENQPGGLAGIAGVQYLEYGLADRWFLTVQPWSDPRGLDWLIVVIMPESDFSQTVLANSRRAALFGALLLVIAVLASLLAAGRLVRGLRRIEQTAHRIAGGDLGARVPGGGIREFDRLAQSFNTMTESLGHARADLESEVERRTNELQGANAELERLSREDSLTGLANRRCFDPRLREEWLRARRAGEQLSLVLCDIDHFKAYNDRYGHSAGDEALRRVAGVLGSSLRRPGDLAARYGGEEFVLLLPGIGASEAERFAQEIREHVLELAIPHEASPRGCVTLSFGIATHTADNPWPAPDLLFKAADQALYRAKDLGRDRVELAAPAV
jgi:diguanylate cyclase (GGDEF)-like protein